MPELDEGGTRVPSQPPPPRATDGLSYTERYRGTEYDSSGLPAKEESGDPLAGIASAVRSLFGGRGQQAPAEEMSASQPDAADPEAALIEAPGRPPMADAPAPRPRLGAPADLLTEPPAAERISYVEYEGDEWDEDRPLAAAQPRMAPEAPPQMAPPAMDESPLPPPDWAQARTQAPLPPPEWAQPAQAQPAQAQPASAEAPLPPPDWAQIRRPPKPTAGQAPAQPTKPTPAPPAPKATPASPAPAQAARTAARAPATPAQPAQPVARPSAPPAQPAEAVARASASPTKPAQAPAAAPTSPPQPARKPPRGSVISRQPATLPPAARPSQVARQSAASARAAEQFRAAEAARVPSMRDQAAMPPMPDDEDERPLLLDDDEELPYSERYRGTEWDSNVQPARRGLALASLTRRAVPIAIVLVLVVGGIGAVAMFGRGIIDGLTGSGDPEPGGAKVIEQFRELADTRDLPFHVTMSTTIAGGNEPIELQAEMDMVDGDSAGTVTFTEAGARIALEMIVKGGATYARVPGAPWQLVPLKQQGILSPLTELGALTGYDDLGLEERNGVSLRHLRTSESGRDDLDAVIELFGDVATIRSSVIDLYLTEDGVPVEMTGTATMSLNQSGKPKQVTLAFEYRFSQVGKTLEITAPI